MNIIEKLKPIIIVDKVAISLFDNSRDEKMNVLNKIYKELDISFKQPNIEVVNSARVELIYITNLKIKDKLGFLEHGQKYYYYQGLKDLDLDYVEYKLYSYDTFMASELKWKDSNPKDR